MADSVIPDPSAELRELLATASPEVVAYLSRYADYLAIGDVQPRRPSAGPRSDHKAMLQGEKLLRHEWARRVWGRK